MARYGQQNHRQCDFIMCFERKEGKPHTLASHKSHDKMQHSNMCAKTLIERMMNGDQGAPFAVSNFTLRHRDCLFWSETKRKTSAEAFPPFPFGRLFFIKKNSFQIMLFMNQQQTLRFFYKNDPLLFAQKSPLRYSQVNKENCFVN